MKREKKKKRRRGGKRAITGRLRGKRGGSPNPYKCSKKKEKAFRLSNFWRKKREKKEW